MPSIYNLLFPAYIQQLSFDDYVFTRVENYRERALQLNQPQPYGDEIDFPANFGTHAITADAATPRPEPPAVLGWVNPTATLLDDILLLLSLFTQRNVWLHEDGHLIGEHRKYQYGVFLGNQLPRIFMQRGAMRLDVGFEPGVRKALSLIRTDAWQGRYRKGHYLLMANQAFRWQILETTFTQCWTIWEHLFSLHTEHWLGKRSLRLLPTTEKIKYLASHYDIHRYAPDLDGERITRLKGIRNELVHFGKFPPGSIGLADDFVEWTEYLIAATLALSGGEHPTVEDYEARA